MRMYIASITCNIAQSYWKHPAQWMYYHLLDADWASNALSWQWVSGAFSSKQYYANQENINKYAHSSQKNTFLDVPYEAFPLENIPESLENIVELELITPLPETKDLNLDANVPTCVYNFYNLDPLWRKELKCNRVLLLEPSLFLQYPVSQKSINFMLELCKNIDNIQVYTGDFNTFYEFAKINDIYFKEHPLNSHYRGKEDVREWIFPVDGYYRSFFAYWKKCKKFQ